jgi:putative transposase
VKYAFIKEHESQYAVIRLCHALSVSPSGYYDWLHRPPSKQAQGRKALLSQIVSIHTEVMENYGSPRMHIELVERGHQVSKGRVARIMHKHGIKAKRSKRHKRTYEHREVIAPVENTLNREFFTHKPNKKWVQDITFIETRQGWLYLAIVLDLYSRAIIGWSMSDRINGKLVLDALDMAITQRRPDKDVLVHSDQGSQYTAINYRDKLKEHGMICSMSRKGECHDNAVAESFFHTLKEELVYDENFATKREARQAIFKYIEFFYNRKRRHSTIGYKAPFVYEEMNAAA